MDDLARRRQVREGRSRKEGIDTILDDVTVARGMVTEARAEAAELGLPVVDAWLAKADDALTGAVAAAERAR